MTWVRLCCIVAAGACTTVRRVEPTAYLEDNAPPVVWVTYGNNNAVPVFEAVIKRDTLRGFVQRRGDRVAIPLTEIQSVQAKVPDHAKTALLLIALGAATVTTMYVGFISQSGSGGHGTVCGVDRKGDMIQDC